MKRGRKTQITVFVIVAISIIIVSLLAYFVYSSIKKTKMSEAELNEAKNYITQCVKERLEKEGLPLIAKQSGYYVLPNESINFLDEKAAFYLRDEKILIPHKREIEKQIDAWITENAQTCLIMPRIKASSFDVSSYLREGEIQVSIKRIKLEREKASSITDAEFSVGIDLLKFLNLSAALVEEYKNETGQMPGYLCVECMDYLIAKHNTNVTIVPVTEKIFIKPHVWFLLDTNQELNNKKLIWRFVTDLR